MNGVSQILLKTIADLQKLPSLKDSSLGGGTNLAIRYGHRKSIDIDLFFSGIIGKSGFESVVKDVKGFYGGNVSGMSFPCDEDDQYIFLRFFVKSNDELIKVEIIQNMLMLDPPEELYGLRLLTQRDIGLLKLMTAANRANFKDIFDLDYLTDKIKLHELFNSLRFKQEKLNLEQHKNIFDLDKEKTPIEFPELLLKFETPTHVNQSRPNHSHTRIEIVEGSKSWIQARSSWRKKVRQLFDTLGLEFPAPTAF